MGVLDYILWTLWFLTLPAYALVQIVALLFTSGSLRWIAALPLLLMVPAYLLFVVGMAQGGDNNVSWLLLILPSPIALLYVSVVVASRFVLPGVKQSQPAAMR